MLTTTRRPVPPPTRTGYRAHRARGWPLIVLLIVAIAAAAAAGIAAGIH